MSNTNSKLQQQPSATAHYQNYTRFHQFQELRKTNPKLYWADATQAAMHKLAEEHQEEFFKSPITQPRNSDGTFVRTKPIGEGDNRVAIDWASLENKSVEEIAAHIKAAIEANKKEIEGVDSNGQ
jgi:hypothetical protein